MMSRSAIEASEHAISSGHELASKAGMDVLEAGGNAVDAGVAAGLALGVLHSDLVNVAGVAPIIARMADSGAVFTIDGLGTWPRAASAEFFFEEFGGEMPEGILRTVVPAAPAAWLTALIDFGTLTFSDVAAAAIGYAREGFPVYPLFAEIIASKTESYAADAATAEIYLPNGRTPQVGETFVQSDLASTLQYMVDQETARGGSRHDGLKAAYDAFYNGDIARTICDHHLRHGGFLTMEDLAEFQVRYEKPLVAEFADSDFYCCGAWCQGISLAQAFSMLDANLLGTLKPNSADYIHHLTEIYKLVFADREHHVADPEFIDVPVDEMLGAEYLTKRLELIDNGKAWPEMPPAGDPRRGRSIIEGSDAKHPEGYQPGGEAHAVSPQIKKYSPKPADLDTSHVGVIDRDGNMFVATPSDTSSDTVVIPGTGLCPSSRGSQSRGIPGHNNAVAPGKRPRLTPNPALALRDGKPSMTLGTPGGDVQIQAMTQVAANILCYGMDVQAAIEAPRFATYSFPSSFAPNTYYPGLLMLEGRIDEGSAAVLQSLGHTVERWDDWTWKAGAVCSVIANEDGTLEAGADPRRASVAMGK